MNENKMNELVQKIVEGLQVEHQESMESHPYLSKFGKEFALIVDWNISGIDVPDTVRIVCLRGDSGYIGVIRFDVEKKDGTYDIENVHYTLEEAEYDLEGNEGKITLLEMVIEDIF